MKEAENLASTRLDELGQAKSELSANAVFVNKYSSVNGVFHTRLAGANIGTHTAGVSSTWFRKMLLNERQASRNRSSDARQRNDARCAHSSSESADSGMRFVCEGRETQSGISSREQKQFVYNLFLKL